MIKAIIFDLGSVCFDIDWIKLNEEMINKFGISTLVRSSGSQKLNEIYDFISEGKANIEDFFKELSKDKADFREVMKFYKEKYKENKKPNDNLLKLIERLKDRYKLICLSDTNQLHFEAHEEQGSLKLFDEVFASFKLGSRKRDKITFLKVLSQIKIAPEETVFIDDSEKNINNAKSLGITSIKYTDYDSLVKKLEEIKII